jgi:hypothetical protein
MRDQAFESRSEACKIVFGDGISAFLRKEREDFADIIDRPRRNDEPCHASAIEGLTDACEGLIRGHTFAAIQFGCGLVDQGLCPVEIVLGRGHEVGDSHGHCLVQRCEVARLDLGFQPPLLFGGKLDCHGP